MNALPFIDIHSHRLHQEDETVMVGNLKPGDAIPAFSGTNFFSVGLHPWRIKTKEENNRALMMMEDGLELDHVIFVGECGLDKLAEPDFDEQVRTFEAQIFMAEEYQKPLIIHCVKAWNEVIELYNETRPTVPWIFHGYNGSLEMTQQLSDKNFLFSFGKMLFRENSKAVESFRFLPLGKVFFETDEYKGQIEQIYQKGAELRNSSLEALKKEIWENFNRIENINFKL